MTAKKGTIQLVKSEAQLVEKGPHSMKHDFFGYKLGLLHEAIFNQLGSFMLNGDHFQMRKPTTFTQWGVKIENICTINQSFSTCQ